MADGKFSALLDYVNSMAEKRPALVVQPDYTEKYNTPIPQAKQAAFNQYVQQEIAKPNGKNPLNDRWDYDVQGDWLAGAARDPATGHGADTWKKPNHPTFSDQSQYHGVDGYVGGSWTDNGYVPSVTNLQMHGPAGLAQYFKNREPDVPLLPQQSSIVPTGAGGFYRISDFSSSPKPNK